MHPQRPLPLHRRLKRPLTRSFFAVQRRAQQCRPRRQSAAVLPSLAPHDSKARLRVVTIRRRFMAKPCTPHPIPQAAQLFKCRSANVRGRGARPLVLSLGGLRGILSFEKESIPLDSCSAVGAAILPLAWNAKHKKRGPRFRTAPFLCRFSSRSRYCSHSHCCSRNRSHRRSRRRRRSG